MAILVSLFGVLGRFAGKVVNAALGWASVLLFGRVPQSKQILLSIVTLGSIVWVIAIVGVLVPDVGTFLIAAVPAPKFIDRNLIRLAMFVAVVVLPLLVGLGAYFLVARSERQPGPPGIALSMARGYPFSFVLAFTLVFLAVVALVRKVRMLARRWEDAHVALVVKPGRYEQLVDEVDAALNGAQLGVACTPAPRILAAPAHLLAAVAGPGVKNLVPDRLMELKADDLEILVYPSDIAIGGTKQAVARARAAVASRLTQAPAYLTTSEQSQQVEDRIEALAREVRQLGRKPAGALVARLTGELREIDGRLASLVVPYDEWEVLYRMRLQVETDLLEREVPEATPGGARPAQAGTRRGAGGRPAGGDRGAAPGLSGLEWAASVVSLTLLAADVTLAVAERVSPPRSRPRWPWAR